MRIRIRPSSGPTFTVQAVLDTGAAISYFDRALLPPLGITDVTAGRPIDLRAASGERSTGYVHSVNIEFVGHPMTIPVAFCPDWPEGTDNLLGMEGFFEQLRAAFEHRARRFYHAIH
jgi:hypothetical protein